MKEKRISKRGIALLLPMAAAAAMSMPAEAAEITTLAAAQPNFVKFAAVSLFVIAMGIWIAMYLYADNTAGLLEEDKIGK